MNNRELAFLGLLVAAIYVWLGVSMIVLRAPILSMLVYYLLLCLGGGSLLQRISQGRRAELYRIPRSRNPLLVTLGWIVLTSAGIWAFRLAFRPGLADPEIISSGIRSLGMTKDFFWVPAGMLIAMNPLCEEFFWRWSVLPVLLGRTDTSRAVVFCSLMFAGYHVLTVSMVFTPLWLAGVFGVVYVGGLILANLMLRTHSLWYPIALHMAINTNLMLLAWLYAPAGTG